MVILIAPEATLSNRRQARRTIGQQLQWNGNNVGSPGQHAILAEGTGGPCGSCDWDAMKFDVRVEDDVVVEIVPVGVDRDDETPEGFRVVEE